MELGKNLTTVSDFSKKIFERNQLSLPKALSQRHPHIVNNLALFWGHKDFNDYTEKLIVNEQTDGRLNRQGFLPDAFIEIIELANLHNLKFPEHQKKDIYNPYGF